MIPQQRDLLIAEVMGLKKEATLAGDLYVIIDGKCKLWNPSENAEQREMIEDWLIKQGYVITFGRAKEQSWYIIEKDLGTGKQIINKLKSEAFLSAVGELCINLNQK